MTESLVVQCTYLKRHDCDVTNVVSRSVAAELTLKASRWVQWRMSVNFYSFSSSRQTYSVLIDRCKDLVITFTFIFHGILNIFPNITYICMYKNIYTYILPCFDNYVFHSRQCKNDKYMIRCLLLINFNLILIW